MKLFWEVAWPYFQTMMSIKLIKSTLVGKRNCCKISKTSFNQTAPRSSTARERNDSQTNSIKYFRRSNTNWIIFFAKFSSHIWKSDSVQLFLLRLCSMCRYLTRRGLIIGIGIRKCTEQPGSSLPLNWGETKVSCNIFRFLRTCHNYIQDSVLHFQDVSSMVLILSTLLLS